MRSIEAISIQDLQPQRQLPPAQAAALEAKDESSAPPTFALRDYQSDLLDKLYALWEGGASKVLLQLPTGAGKTICLAAVIDRALAKEQTCLVVVHREELLSQTIAKVAAITGTTAGIIKAGRKPTWDTPVQVASIATLVNRLSQYPSFDVLILDECHHSSSHTWQKVINHFSQSLLLGVSATPIRLDGQGFQGTFDELVCGVATRGLIEQGHLSKYKYYSPADALDLRSLKSKAGEYTRESIEAANSAIDVAAHCLKAYQDHLWGKQTLVFATSVLHSQQIAASFAAQGISSAHLDGRDPSELRTTTMDAFRSGAIRVLTNCALFTEGLDVPGIDAVILARPTQSLGLWLQMVGRALRPAPGKEYAIIIDLAENWTRFGLPADERYWSLAGCNPKPRGNLVKDESGEIIEKIGEEKLDPPPGLTIDMSPSDLQLKEIAPSTEPPLPKEDLARWQAEIDRLISICDLRGYKIGWIGFELGKLRPPLEVWHIAGRRMGFKPGWAHHQHQDFTKNPRKRVIPMRFSD